MFAKKKKNRKNEQKRQTNLWTENKTAIWIRKSLNLKKKKCGKKFQQKRNEWQKK